ncbi:MAG: hypothetical protein J1F35_03015 [Erysipelotrichales bacterium]|nr:hypothetical protein [Erysipelotrichales bacterium]
MEARDLKKLSLSNLAFIALNPTSKSDLKKFAEIEIQYRMRNLGMEYQDFLHNENECLNVRGFDLRNYLIGPKPTMQQLMELYYKELYGNQLELSNLLFSERHLCNVLDFPGGFFNRICDLEIDNLDRLSRENATEYNELSLDLFKQALVERKTCIEDTKKFYEGSELFTLNDAVQYISDEMMLEFGTNLTDEQYYQLSGSRLRILKHLFLEFLNDGILDADFFQESYALWKALEDRSKLSLQRRILLSEAKNGNSINYKAPEMQAVLKKIKTHLNEQKNESK